jgi:hypothetical protein
MNRRPFADTATIRAAIFDVIDAGDEGYAWEFPLNESDRQTERRTRFADAVVSMIEDLQSNFKFVRLENLCPRHRGEALPMPSVQVCAQCAAEQRAKGQGA